jgi:hypothetical protein
MDKILKHTLDVNLSHLNDVTTTILYTKLKVRKFSTLTKFNFYLQFAFSEYFPIKFYP